MNGFAKENDALNFQDKREPPTMPSFDIPSDCLGAGGDQPKSPIPTPCTGSEGTGAFTPVKSGQNTSSETNTTEHDTNIENSCIDEKNITAEETVNNSSITGTDTMECISKQSDEGIDNKKDFPVLINHLENGTQETESIKSALLEETVYPKRLRKRSHAETTKSTCPVCGLLIRDKDIPSHFLHEIDKLDKWSRSGRLSKGSLQAIKKSCPTPSTSSQSVDVASTSASPDLPRYETYLRVKASRQNRMSSKSKNRRKQSCEEVTCPVCNDRITGSQDELTQHVEECLNKKEDNLDVDVDVDIEGDESYEEYSWAGQTRIRVSSMLQGGLKASGFATASKNEEDEDIDLDVDGDEEAQFGAAQYTEADIIPCGADEPWEEKENKALRGAFLRGEKIKAQPVPDDRTKWEKPVENEEKSCDMDTSSNVSLSSQEVIKSLKSRIKELEASVSSQDKKKCLICMESYSKPAVSVQCWHVHCEECWLRTLGAKKLCPQCNTITSASDLRRIFL